MNCTQIINDTLVNFGRSFVCDRETDTELCFGECVIKDATDQTDQTMLAVEVVAIVVSVALIASLLIFFLGVLCKKFRGEYTEEELMHLQEKMIGDAREMMEYV